MRSFKFRQDIYSDKLIVGKDMTEEFGEYPDDCHGIFWPNELAHEGGDHGYILAKSLEEAQAIAKQYYFDHIREM